jgi:serine/threonine protein kinase
MESFIKSLSLKQQVGAGGFGKIFLARNDEGCYAVKAISKSKGQAHNIAREVQAGRTLKHKNITNFICQFDDESNDYMVFDFIKGKMIKRTNSYPIRKRSIFLLREAWLQNFYRE